MVLERRRAMCDWLGRRHQQDNLIKLDWSEQRGESLSEFVPAS